MNINFIETGISALTTTATSIVYLLIIPFLIIYILGEARGWRGGVREPNLGAKLIAALFLSLSFQVAVMGLAAILSEFVHEQTTADRSMISRNAWGLFLGGVVSGLIPAVFYGIAARRGQTKTQSSGISLLASSRDSIVLRQALGINAIIAHAIVTLSVISLFVLLLGKQTANIWPTLFVAIVYAVAAIACLAPLFNPREATLRGGQTIYREEVHVAP